jgi:hypothetical protein
MEKGILKQQPSKIVQQFLARDGRRNSKATTIGNCVTKCPRKFATTRKENYTTK